MPSGKIHDAITAFLIAPTFAATYLVTRDLTISTVVTSGMVFGGLMFGPDLDTVSNQYARWGLFKFLWYPYRTIFPHRSRWSHGLIFGTLLRVIYLMGSMTLLAFLVIYLFAAYTGGTLPNLLQITNAWMPIGDFIRTNFGDYAMSSMFVGLWLGATSHTLTDMAVTFIKTGRITEFL